MLDPLLVELFGKDKMVLLVMMFGEVEWKQEEPRRLCFFRRCSRRVGGQAAGGKETEGGQGGSCEGIWGRTAQRADASGRGM